MIVNLPEQLDTQLIGTFSFGNADAKRDEIISNNIYVTCISALSMIRTGNYNLIVGERGTGKSAIFKLFKDKQVLFITKNGIKDHCIFIESDFELSSFKKTILTKIRTGDNSKENELYKYQLSWEFYFTYRLLQIIQNELGIYEDDLSDYLSKFEELLGHIQAKGILAFFKSLSFTAGVKSSFENPNNFEPYIRIEPSKKTEVKADQVSDVLFDLANIKNRINQVLFNNKIIIRFLIDKLDDFAVKEEYDIQRMILQSLLSVEDSYFNTSNLRMYIFLRKDLYERLDFVALGADKVKSRTVELIWEKKDIWNFIAKRIFYNYKNVLGLDALKFTKDNFNFKMEEKSIPPLFQSDSHFSKFITNLLSKIFKKSFRIHKSLKKNSIDFNEEINREIIFSIMPEKVPHYDENGKLVYINFLDFIISHFELGSGHVNPRHIIIYFNMLFSNLQKYYNNNPQFHFINCENGKYNLIPEEIIQETYTEFQNSLIEIFCNLDKRWNDWFIKFQTRRGIKYTFKYKDLIEMLQIHEKKEADFKRFLAFFVHSGFFYVPDNYKDYNKKVFVLPIVLRRARKNPK